MDVSVYDMVTRFNMLPHPEGGWYKETYRAQGIIPHNALPENFAGSRNFSTAIYFLLEQGNFSAFHRIQSDECWHFYAGGPLVIYIIDATGGLQKVRLGSNILQGETFQFVVQAGCWFASAPAEGTIFSVVGCTVAPGFDFADFELAERDALLNQFPQHRDVITALTRS
jgi:predicted cupin superfamily sugar epimerase